MRTHRHPNRPETVVDEEVRGEPYRSSTDVAAVVTVAPVAQLGAAIRYLCLAESVYVWFSTTAVAAAI